MSANYWGNNANYTGQSFNGAKGSNALGARINTNNNSYGTTHTSYDRNMSTGQNVSQGNYDRSYKNVNYNNAHTIDWNKGGKMRKSRKSRRMRKSRKSRKTRKTRRMRK